MRGSHYFITRSIAIEMMLRGLVLAAIALGADAACPAGDGAAPCPPIGHFCANALYGAGSATTCQTVGGLDVAFSKSGTTTKLTATYAGTPAATGIWIAVGLGNAMVGSAVAIGQLYGTAGSFKGEYKIATKLEAFQDTVLTTTIKNPTIASADGKVVRSADRWALGRWLPEELQARLYRIALDRGFEQVVVGRLFVVPFLRLLESAAELERRWLALLSGSAGPGGRRS